VIHWGTFVQSRGEKLTGKDGRRVLSWKKGRRDFLGRFSRKKGEARAKGRRRCRGTSRGSRRDSADKRIKNCSFQLQGTRADRRVGRSVLSLSVGIRGIRRRSERKTAFLLGFLEQVRGTQKGAQKLGRLLSLWGGRSRRKNRAISCLGAYTKI